VIHYYLRDKAEVTVEVVDGKGKRVAKLEASGGPGVSRAVWDLKRATDKGRTAVAAGEYEVRLTVDGSTLTRRLRVTGP